MHNERDKKWQKYMHVSLIKTNTHSSHDDTSVSQQMVYISGQSLSQDIPTVARCGSY